MKGQTDSLGRPAGDALATAARAFVQEVSPAEAQDLIARDQALWIDVREPEEAQALEAPPGALHLPLSSLPASALMCVQDRDRPLIVACGAGRRSALAAVRLEQAGFTRVYSLTGGLVAWLLQDGL